MSDGNVLTKEGYLSGNFRFFHLRDTAGQEREMHYHEFAKIVIFLDGKVDYLVEGTSYPLRPWDILLIGPHLAHRALIDTATVYERIILYVDPAFLEAGTTDLMRCFRAAQNRAFYLMRLSARDQTRLSAVLRTLEQADGADDFGAALMEETSFLQLMVLLNRVMLTDKTDAGVTGLGYDVRIAQVLSHINTNLETDLTAETLAQRCYMSRYHFMRLFKRLTGYTVHSYVQQKRLLLAAELLKNGHAATDAAERSGFRDYSTFQRAFKAEFGVTPSAYV